MVQRTEQVAHSQLVGGEVTGLHLHPSSTLTRVRAYNASMAQTLAKGAVLTKIYLPSVEFDELGEFNTSLYRFVAGRAGYRLFVANVGGSQGSVSTMNLYLYKNGVSHSQAFVNTAYPHYVLVDMFWLNVGDYVELWGAAGQSLAVPLIIGQANLWLSVLGL